jgi:mRNA interferase RelE/StbE
LTWRVEIDPSAAKDLSKIDRTWQDRILNFLKELRELPDPRSKGAALTANLARLWRYRVGDYRIICRIEDDVMIIQVIKIAHRSRSYR